MPLHDNHEGETPMTDYQFKRFEELKDKCVALEQELDALRGENSHCDKGMAGFQYKSAIEMIYQLLKVSFEAGKTPDEILATIAELKDD